MFFPEYIAIAGVKADGIQSGPVFVGSRQEDVMVPDDGCRSAGAGQIGGPFDIIGGADDGRQVYFIRGAVEVWASPLGPIVGEGQAAMQDYEGKKDRFFHISFPRQSIPLTNFTKAY